MFTLVSHLRVHTAPLVAVGVATGCAYGRLVSECMYCTVLYMYSRVHHSGYIRLGLFTLLVLYSTLVLVVDHCWLLKKWGN